MDVLLRLEVGAYMCGKGAKAFEDTVLPKHFPNQAVDVGDARALRWGNVPSSIP